MSRGRFDYSEFKRYRDNFMNMYNQFYSWLEGFLYQQGMKFLAIVRPITPVDTGDLRDHWQLEGISIEGDSVNCWFINPMEYTTFVEYGHAKPYKAGAPPGSADWVDGRFMMTISIEAIQRDMPSEFDVSFETFVKGMGLL